MNAEIEAFCEKHILPRDTRYNLMLAIEEILEILKPDLRAAPLDLAVDVLGENGRRSRSRSSAAANGPIRSRAISPTISA